MNTMNVPVKFEVRSFARSWDNRGYPKFFVSPWIRSHFLFSKNFNGLFGWTLWTYWPNLKKRRCWANCSCNQFPRFPATLQTDRRTDGRTSCNRNTALCTIMHRAVIIWSAKHKCAFRLNCRHCEFSSGLENWFEETKVYYVFRMT